MRPFARGIVLLGLCLAAITGRAATYSNGWESVGEYTSYNTFTALVNGVRWAVTNGVVTTNDTGDVHSGTRAARLRAIGGSVTMMDDKVDGISNASFRIARYGADAASYVRLDVSTNQGAVWTTVFSTNATLTSLIACQSNLLRMGGTRIRFVKTSGNSTVRMNIDDIVLTDYAPSIRLLGTNRAALDPAYSEPAPSNGTDFGSSPLGLGVTNRFWITNSGPVALAVSGITTASAMGAAADFAVLSAPTSISPWAVSGLVVRFSPLAAGLRTGVLAVASSDPDTPSHPLFLWGRGAAPEIGVSGLGVALTNNSDATTAAGSDFGTGVIGRVSVTRTFMITNSGTYNLTNGAPALSGPHAGDFAIAQAPAVLVAPGGTTALAITFAPLATGARTASVSWANSDANESPFTLALAGVGITTATVATAAAAGISQAGATVGGTVSADGGTPVSERGVYWSTATNPAAGGTAVAAGMGTGAFSTALSGLAAGQLYYVRAYASNAAGLALGPVVSFSTPCMTSAPALLPATYLPGPGFLAAWSNVAGAASYNVDVTLNGLFTAGTTAGVLAAYAFPAVRPLEAAAMSSQVTAAELRVSSGNIVSNRSSTSGFTSPPYIQSSGGWGSTNAEEAKYFEVTVYPLPGRSLTITGVTFQAASANNGPAAFTLDVDNGATVYTVNAPSEGVSTIARAVTGVVARAAPVVVRIKGWNNRAQSNSGGGPMMLDELGISGRADYAPVYLSGYSNQTAAGESAAVTGAQYDVTYYYRVQAAGAAGCAGAWSATQSVLLSGAPLLPAVAVSGAAGTGQVSDAEMAAGSYRVAVQATAPGSGILVSNALAPSYAVLGPAGLSTPSTYFATPFTNGTIGPVSLSGTGPAVRVDAVGSHTAAVAVASAGLGYPVSTARVAFAVYDDDSNAPAVLFAGLSVGGTNYDLRSGPLTITGLVQDVSGIDWAHLLLLRADGTVAASNTLSIAPNGAFSTTVASAGLACGQAYGVSLVLCDADADRVGDALASTSLAVTVQMIGAAPVADAWRVDGQPSPGASLTDAQLAAGGWSLALSVQHPDGFAIEGADRPAYSVLAPDRSTLLSGPWPVVTAAADRLDLSNAALMAVSPDAIRLGLHALCWYAVSTGDCAVAGAFRSDVRTGSNTLLVVDDDAEGPLAPTGLVCSATGWTNDPQVVVAWGSDQVLDASGVAGFRLLTGTNAPASVTDGADLGAALPLSFTWAREGVTTGWIFGVDADADRPGDAAAGATTALVLKMDFTPPARVLNFEATTSAVNEAGQAMLSWRALPDAGGAALSPWHTYRIYYTENGDDPDAQSPYWDHDRFQTLATNDTDTLSIDGLAMGAQYRFAIAGEDVAGNVGPISGVQTLQLGRITITQAFINARSETAIAWTGHPDVYYDVIYADCTGYFPEVDVAWTLADCVRGPAFTDAGGATRAAPAALAPNVMRFYRVSTVEGWLPNGPGQPGGASTQIVVAARTVLSNGYNFVGLAARPTPNTLASFFGTNRLPAGNRMATSTRISTFLQPNRSGDAGSNSWWLSSSAGWQYEFGGSANGQALPYPGRGYEITLPPGAGSTNLLIAGVVPWAAPDPLQLETGAYHVLSLNLPRPTRMRDLNLKDVMTRAPILLNADEIRILQRGLGPFASPKARIFVATNGTYTLSTGASANNYVVDPDDAIIVYTKKLAKPTSWQPVLPYDPPRLEITNDLLAPPSAQALRPLGVTASGALLRGAVNPRKGATSAGINYGLTTNCEFNACATNLESVTATFKVQAAVTNLLPDTTYYLRVWGSNGVGVSRFGTRSFRTLPATSAISQ